MSSRDAFKLFYQSTETPHRHRCLKCGAVRIQNLKHGYNNLINNLNSCKPRWKNEFNSVSDQQPLIFVSERARNVFGLIEWVVLEGRVFFRRKRTDTKIFESEEFPVKPSYRIFRGQPRRLEVFKKPIELSIEQNDDKSYAESLLDQKRRKPMSHYGDLKWIPPTSNLAERLFSRVKYVFNDHRKSLLPVNLESQIFLCVNRSFWDAKTIEDLMWKNNLLNWNFHKIIFFNWVQ